MDRNSSRFEVLGFLIILLTFVAFFPSISNGFINYDDPVYVTENPFVRDFSLSKIPEIFRSRSMNIYNPLVTLSFAFDYRMGGGKPQFFHFHNLMLHILTTILVFRFMYIWTKSLFIAFWCAVFFGIHPLHVESVAWIAERKDVLSGALLTGAMNLWLEYRKRSSWLTYLGVWFLLSLSLLVKPVGILFPFLVWCLDRFSGQENHKWPKPDVLAFFLLAFPAFYFAVGHQSLEQKLDKTALPFTQLVFVGIRNFNWYIEKAFWPVDLSIFYPMSELQKTTFSKEMFTFVLLFSAFSVAFIKIKSKPEVRAGLLLFLLLQIPYLKFVPFGNDFICADRYFYFSSIGFFLYFIGIIAAVSEASNNQKVLGGICLVLTLVTITFSGMTWSRCKNWHNSETLWHDAVTKYPGSADAWNNLGVALSYRGKEGTIDAIECFRKAYEIDPSMKIAEDNLEKFLKELDSLEP
ncbi:MAG: hypothetical protein CVV42_19770 [Candidatus Riflebacteria bacterium HGW-Riflebacteria-2]|nr:MAG: hypothetical protein CVV42_19770 [Candidatus Riflebacteria bacterium HGW-Riflebacteria-2]